MNFMFVTAVLLISTVLAAASCFDNKIETSAPNLNTLKFFAAVTRHGSRSPLKTFPKDLYPFNDKKFWPNGPNELTNLGKVQLFHTGKYLKSMYKGFVDDYYNPNSSIITYNPYNRDFMSSACLSAGLYPPVGSQVWDTALPWQPVVQSLRDFDICDLATNNACPRYKYLYNKEVDKFNADSYKERDLLIKLSQHLGANLTKLTDFYDVYDTFLMQDQNGYILPNWTKDVFPNPIRSYAVKYLLQTYAGNKELIQLGAGPELKFISEMLTNKADGNETFLEKKFYIEAAHDCTLISLLRALGNEDKLLEIQTAAFLVFELHCQNKDCTVETFYYRSSYDNNPEAINIKGCPSPCSLKHFNTFVNSINPPDWNAACGIMNKSELQYRIAQ